MNTAITPHQPHIVQGPGKSIDPSVVGQTMQELGVSSETIDKTIIFVDPANRLATNGITYPNRLGRLRHIANPDLRNAKGPIVRLSTRVRGADRSVEDMNVTLTHELEHVAQMDRRDTGLRIGHAAIWGLATLGAVVGYHMGHSKASRIGLGISGMLIGHQIGYKIAPHERQARSVANTVTTTAIHSHSSD